MQVSNFSERSAYQWFYEEKKAFITFVRTQVYTERKHISTLSIEDTYSFLKKYNVRNEPTLK